MKLTASKLAKSFIIAVLAAEVGGIAAEVVTSETRTMEVTPTGRSGPVVYGAQWTIETNQGPIRVTGGLSYLKDEKLNYGGDISNALKIGVPYCAEVKRPGVVSRIIFGRDTQKPYFGLIEEKKPGMDCRTVKLQYD